MHCSQENAVAHIFLTRPQPDLQTPDPAPQPIRTTRPATASKALPALNLPSKSLIALGQTRFDHDGRRSGENDGTQELEGGESRWLWVDPAPLQIPRVAAREPKPQKPPTPCPMVLFRQIVELPAFDEARTAAVESALSKYDTWQNESAEREASFQMSEDPRTPEEVAKADALVERVLRAREEVERAKEEPRKAAEEAERAAELLRGREERARLEEEQRVKEVNPILLTNDGSTRSARFVIRFPSSSKACTNCSQHICRKEAESYRAHSLLTDRSALQKALA
jgi:hypothetical protein